MSKVAEPFICGGLSGCLASTFIHPIDLSKVRLQLYKTQNPGKSIPSFVAILSQMIKNEGIGSIYAGITAAILRQCVYGTARIGLHRTFSDMMIAWKGGNNLSFGEKVASGMASGCIAVCVGTPFDVALVRMQGDTMKPELERRGYKNAFDAVSRVAREEGVIKLYSGLGPSVLRGMAMNVGQLAFFDQSKEFIHQTVMGEPKSKSASKLTQLCAAIIAGFSASALSLPFDLLKSRMQDSTKGGSLLNVAYKVYTQEGVLAFWTGFGAFFGRTAPHSMIVLLSTEPIVQMYRKLNGY